MPPAAAINQRFHGALQLLQVLYMLHILNGHILIDPAHEAAERLSGSDFNEGIHAVRNHALHALLPADRRGNLFHQKLLDSGRILHIIRGHIGQVGKLNALDVNSLQRFVQAFPGAL